MNERAKPIENLGKIGDAHIDLVPTLDQCSGIGIEPTEYNVIIAMAKAPEKTGKLGLVYVPDDVKENNALAMQVGRIVAASPVAFNYERWPEDTSPPQVGDIVWFARYAGGLLHGFDGNEYRMVKDKDIGAIIRPPTHVTEYEHVGAQAGASALREMIG